MSASDKYWVTDLRTTSVKSPYAVRLTLVPKPKREDEIIKWLEETHGKGSYIYKIVDTFYHAEIFFKSESDVTMFILMWSNALKEDEE